eukprot:Gb_11132 [translate_table: standard]
MATALAIPLSTTNYSAGISNFRYEILSNFNFSNRNELLGTSRDLGLRFPSKSIGYTRLSRMPLQYRCLPICAAKSLEDGDTEVKPVELPPEKPEAARQVLSNSDEGQKEKYMMISRHGWGTGLALLGFIETAYLTYIKVIDSDVYCLLGGGSCGDVLNSDYATVFGVPLPLIGMAGYGVVALLGLQLARRKTLFGFDGDKVRWLLLGCTSSMAAASAYFMYLLTVKLEGASCAYCVTSALLSFSLLLITLRDFSLREVQQVAGLQISTAALVIAALSTAYGTSGSAVAGRLDDIDLPPVEPVVTTQSSPRAISLAEHLRSVGAKLYGAFWCSHCFEQKQMFGHEAMDILDYVECYPNGYRKGVKIAKACEDANIQGFPTWIVKGQVLSGEQVFDELARISGFDLTQLPT